ncbi:MAG: SpoIIE family protein phosphatase [Anaerolineaceae bacterium]|nr:SpoIIE family protein phosphatase [Anaerolineaceae bacterium]
MISTLDERVEFLRNSLLFPDPSFETLVEIATQLEDVEYQPDETIFEAGDAGDYMYFVKKGQVRVHTKNRTIQHLGVYDIFGEMALLDSRPRMASVTSLEKTDLLRLNKTTFDKLIHGRIEIVQGITVILTKRLRFHDLELQEMEDNLEKVILPLGIALSTEKNLDHLVERILLEAKKLCSADAGTMYLLTAEKKLKFSIMFTDSLNIALGGSTGKEIPFPPISLVDEKTGEPNYHNVSTYVAITGNSVNIPDIYHAKEFDFTGTMEFDKRMGYRSISSLTVPLKNHIGEVIGVIQLFNAQNKMTGQVVPFNPYQQMVVESLASQAAVSLNTQELLRRQEILGKIEHDVQVGRQIQADFLPDVLPQPEGWEIEAFFQPAREVAGDFYDAFMIDDNQVGFVIADVCDKGVGAALFMALSRSLIRAFGWMNSKSNPRFKGSTPENQMLDFIEMGLDPIGLTNNYIAQIHGKMNMFVTLFFGMLDPKKGVLTYINAGHNPPVLLDSTGRIKARLTLTGPAVGMLPDIIYTYRQLTIEPGDVLFLFTDGVPESHNPDGKLLTEKRMLELLSEPVPAASVLLNRIVNELKIFMSTANPFDDVTMLAIRRKPE